MGLAKTVREALERPQTRWLLTPLATGKLTWRHRSPCLVYPIGGGWVHRFGSGTLVAGDIGAPRPESLRAHVEDIFLFDAALSAGDVVVDVGAGVGEEALTFSSLVGPGGRVISIEANPAAFRLLQQNCRRNGLGNVEPVQRAVADRAGTVRITNDGADVANRLTTGEGVEVPASTLDDLADELRLGTVALLKMNIEGAERLALKGMTRFISQVRSVCICCHDFLDRDGDDASMATKAIVSEFLQDHGFTLRTREEDSRPWVRDTVYASRPVPAVGPDEGSGTSG